jgi:large subunit ribosomal protein L28
MAKRCEICGKSPLAGHRISHSDNVSNRRWLPNLQRVRVVINGESKRIHVCAECIRSGALEKLQGRG